MRRFRFSSWKFMLVMFVLITIFYSDLGYIEQKKSEPPIKEQSSTPEDEIDAMDVQ